LDIWKGDQMKKIKEYSLLAQYAIEELGCIPIDEEKESKKNE
tara:strand:+ start:647 stop:772 length:126 start_codon:yes stop_codon:yes gene_type:complete